MKLTVILLLCGVSQFCFSQTTNNIKEVKTLNVYGNGKVIIGQIVINQLTKTKILLADITQEKDSSGVYTTTYRFVPELDDSGFKFNISIVFDQPFIEPFYSNFFSTDVGSVTQYTFSKDVKQKYISAKGNTTSSQISFFVKSYKPVKATIHGVDGEIKK